MTRASMRFLELESRFAVIRTVGSNPTLSANSLAVDMSRQRRSANALQTFRHGPEPYLESAVSLYADWPSVSLWSAKCH